MLSDVRFEAAEVQRTFGWDQAKREASGLARLRLRANEITTSLEDITAQILESEEVAGVAEAKENVAKKKAELLDHPDMDELRAALKQAKKQARKDGAALYEAKKQHKASLAEIQGEIATKTQALIDGMANSAK